MVQQRIYGDRPAAGDRIMRTYIHIYIYMIGVCIHIYTIIIHVL